MYLAPFYGQPLQYYGELSGAYWPRRIAAPPYRRPGEQERQVAERFGAIEFTPEYFVITDFQEYSRHHGDLKGFLEQNGALVASSETCLIYDLRQIDWETVFENKQWRAPDE